jgi:Putative zinc-binding metallo-peptidase
LSLPELKLGPTCEVLESASRIVRERVLSYHPGMPRSVPRKVGPDELSTLSDEQLLDLQFRQLDVRIEGTELATRIDQLNSELGARNLAFRPHFWLSDEWFTPDGIPGVAIPFYLAHPRLAKLELAQMLEIEGGDHDWCMRILRHEAGHAIDNAFHLRRRQKRRELFGSSREPYPEYYTPKPYSKNFVLHLDPWYAQSHPDEDFAETFAVWVTPDAEWRQRYQGWPAIKKLQYVDHLMQSLNGRPPTVVTAEVVDPMNALHKTLRQHYRRKRRHYGIDYPSFYDRDLRRLFSDAPEHEKHMTAAQFLTRIRKPLRKLVGSWTGIYQYTIDQVFEDMIERCRQLNLRLAVPEEQARVEFTVLLTVQTMNYLHSGGHRVAL